MKRQWLHSSFSSSHTAVSCHSRLGSYGLKVFRTEPPDNNNI